MSSPRQTAFEILMRVEKNKAFSNKALDASLKKLQLSKQDKSFVSALVYGVLERRITLDYQISLYLSKSINRLKPQVLTILRIGMYQLFFMNKIPASACVNESVKLSKKNKCDYASSLINAILRKASISIIEYPDKSDLIKYLSVKFSVQEWIAKSLTENYGFENAEKMLENSFGRPPVYIRVNTIKTTKKELCELLEKENIIVSDVSGVENALIIENFDSLQSNDLYIKGFFHVQDIASQLCCKVLAPQKGETVIDMCSAPGGKSFTTAELMENCGKIYSYDIYDNKINTLLDGAKRLGISIINASVHDGTVLINDEPCADKVLCDVPCSGLGTLRRKPEIRYKSFEDVSGLPEVQYKILKNASEYVKTGGTLVYSTCTVNVAENENIVNRFIKDNPDFEITDAIEDTECFRRGKTITLMPHINSSDGFFICKMKRKC